MKKVCRYGFVGIGLAVLAMLGGVVAQVYVTPYLAAQSWSAHVPLLRDAVARTTVVEKVVRTTITEDDAVRHAVARVRNSIVRIYFADETFVDGAILTTDGIVAIAAPVAPEQRSGTALLADGTVVAATYDARDALTGVVFFRLDAQRDYVALSLSRVKDLFVGQRVIAIAVDGSVRDRVRAQGAHIRAIRMAAADGDGIAWDAFVETDAMAAIYVTRGGDLAAFGDAERLLPGDAIAAALTRRLADRHAEAPRVPFAYRVATTPRDAAPLGALIVTSVAQAARAELRVGDVIVAINGAPVTADMPLAAHVVAAAPLLTLTVRAADGATREVAVRLVDHRAGA